MSQKTLEKIRSRPYIPLYPFSFLKQDSVDKINKTVSYSTKWCEYDNYKTYIFTYKIIIGKVNNKNYESIQIEINIIDHTLDHTLDHMLDHTLVRTLSSIYTINSYDIVNGFLYDNDRNQDNYLLNHISYQKLTKNLIYIYINMYKKLYNKLFSTVNCCTIS